MKKAVFLSLLLVALLVALVFALQFDDELDPEAILLVELTSPADESEAYLYSIGMHANDNEDPVTVGQHVLEQYQARENDDTHEIIHYSENTKLPLPKDELFCRSREEGCLERLFSATQDELEEAINAYPVLLKRLAEFYTLSDFATLTKPGIEEPIPDFQYITRGEMLLVLSAIHAYKQGDTQAAIKILLNRFSDLRSALVQQNALIGKKVFIQLLSHSLDVLSVITAEQQLTTVKLNALSDEEMSLNTAFAREFALSYYLIKDLDKTLAALAIDGNIPRWMTTGVFKPNITINTTLKEFTKLEHFKSLVPSEFAVLVESSNEVTRTKTFNIRNTIGNYLSNIAQLNPEQYIVEIIDLDIKIMLFNHLPASFEQIKNPYYPSEGLTNDDGNICFRSPVMSKNSSPCLRTNL